MSLGVILFASCAKETVLNSEPSTEKTTVQDQKRSQKIMDFHDAMNGTSLELRSSGDGPSEYTPEEFLKNTEEAINYTYAIPFDKYWEVQTKKDTIFITISDCKILASEGSPKYQQILDKIKCKFNCSNLSNKKLKFTKVSLINKTCTQLKVEVITSVGSTTVTAANGPSNPSGPSGLANFRRVFTQDLNGYAGPCNVPVIFGSFETSADLAGKATYNIIGGTDFVHTLIDMENRYMDSYNTPEANWWYAQCDDPIDGSNPGGCGGYTDCSVYYNIDPITGNIDYDDPTILGEELMCLTVVELNSILGTTESYCKSQASAANKDFVNVSAHWDASLCEDLNQLWRGNLTIGKKIYRLEIPTQLSTSTCNCTE